MKLLNKILTATLPVSLVGILTPTIVSCSCNKKTLTLNYKDTINCMFSDKDNYHKHDDIVNALKPHLVKEGRKEITQEYLNAKINSQWTTDETIKQWFFWDLAAAYAIVKNEDVYLAGWSVDAGGATVSFTLNNDDLSQKTLSYVKEDGVIKISGAAEKVQSYIFSDCY